VYKNTGFLDTSRHTQIPVIIEDFYTHLYIIFEQNTKDNRMNEQLEQIYIDVLKDDFRVAVKKQIGNRFHVITYRADPLILAVADKMGADPSDLGNQGTVNDYILEDDND